MRESSSGGSLFRSPFFWAAVAGLIFIPLMRPLLRREPPPPEPIFQLPAFELTDSRGKPFGSEDLEGQVWVANFIFTRCASICPALTDAMSRLDARYREEGVEGIRLVSFSVDPEYDTPEVLRDYGKRRGIDPSRWSLLSGPTERVRSVVEDGFKTAMGPMEETEGGLIDVAHTGKFVIVDGSGSVRGYYDSDALGLDEIFHRSQHVLKESRR